MSVGMYPSFTDKFNLPVPGGKYEGLSVELGRYIASELSLRLPQSNPDAPEKVQVEIVSFAWQDLLSELSKNSIDMVISSVTATKKREEEFGISFSKGYYVTHQMLLSNQLTYDSGRSLFENMRKKRIGAVKGTTNERAAIFLSEKCKCEIEIKSEYLELIESKSALFKREIDLLLTDDIWLTGQSNLATFNQFGPPLDGVLSEFYIKEYGRPQEEYAIAFAKRGGEEILQIINEILSSEKAKQFIATMEAKAKGQFLQSSRSDIK
jgi:ABC-type amino acid transport substrate-binding protein